MNSLYNLEGSMITESFITPEMYGALGDGTTDDSTAIQSALDVGGLIVFKTGVVYKIAQTLRIKKNTVIDLNGAVINSTNKHLLYNFVSTDTFTGYNGNGNITIKNGTIIGGAISFAHGKSIFLENIAFRNSLNDHFLEIAGCDGYTIKNCSFVGMEDVQTSVYEYINLDPCVYQAFPWLDSSSVFYDGTKNNNIKVEDCYFAIGSDSYAYGFNAFGVHGQWDANTFHSNIVFKNNKLRGFTGCGVRLNNMQGVFVFGNDISVTGDGIRVGDVAQSTNVIIKGNVIVANGSAITKANNSTVFQATDNDINPTLS